MITKKVKSKSAKAKPGKAGSIQPTAWEDVAFVLSTIKSISKALDKASSYRAKDADTIKVTAATKVVGKKKA